MTTWTRIDFGPNVRLHAVSAELREALLVDMAARGHVPTATFGDPAWEIEKPITEWHLDRGGGVVIGEPIVEITVDGLCVSCWAAQIEDIIRRCRRFGAARTFVNEQAYHKIHTWPAHALVVTPAQHAAIIDGFTAAVPDANARVDAFIRSARGADAPAPDWTN